MPEQQLVEIAKAIGARARILILDEPTASLTDREVERLFRVIGTLRGEGAGIIYISHRLDEVAVIADRVTVLRDGQTIATRNLCDVDRGELVRLMVGRDIHAIFPKRDVPIGEIALDVRNLGCRAAGIHDVTFAVRRGEILGIAGLVGSGRTELAETLFGLTPADEGAIGLRDSVMRIESPAEAIRMKLGYLPEDRRQHGVVMEMPIAANTSLANLDAVSRHGLIDGVLERNLARSLRGATAHQDALDLYGDGVALRRQSTEGRGGAVARHRPRGADSGRADAGSGHRVEIGDPRDHGQSGGAGNGDCHDIFGTAGNSGDERQDRSDAQWHDRGHFVARGSDAGEDSRPGAGTRLMLERHRREFSLIVAILAIGVVLAVVAPGFFTFANQRDLVLANMPVLIVALGMVLVILTGQIDISVGSQFAICSVVTGVFARMGLPTPLAGAAACLVGALMGGINGALVAWVRIPSIVVTLATMVALRDGLRWVTQGAWVQDLPPGFQWFGQSQAASELITAVCAAVLAVGMNWGLRNLAAGRVVYATGSSPNAARLAGINPRLVVFAVFVLTGALTGFAAVFNAVRFHQIPSNAGIGLELKVIAAAVVGGVAISGGRGTIAGMLLGLLLLGVIGPALTFLGLSAYWERAIEGGIILAAVSMDAVRVRSGKHAEIVSAQPA